MFRPLPGSALRSNVTRGNKDKPIRVRLHRRKVVPEPVFAPLFHMCAQPFGGNQRLFFICVPKFAQKSPDGGCVCGNASGNFQCSGGFWQGDITILRHQFFQKSLMSRQFTMARRAALELWLDRARFPQLALPSHPSGGGHTAISAKMARTVHAVVKHGEPYRPFFEAGVPRRKDFSLWWPWRQATDLVDNVRAFCLGFRISS
ncbi:hypothetical protein GV827_17470 [Sulfitobacter sp. JBTF-M27]|uniref:Uncharacterized protein n=1 Tax=Sulfitobacter sediminilitoris TaxID=2698830 RepID=A0A6P0CD99_9RHOB|nr:hypothetical protein [Sulfitobacter sediminilitoris]